MRFAASSLPVLAALLLLGCPAARPRPAGPAAPSLDLRLRPSTDRTYLVRQASSRLQRGGLLEIETEATARVPATMQDAGPFLELGIDAVRVLRNGRVVEDHRPEGLSSTAQLSEAGALLSLSVHGGDEAAHDPVRHVLAELLASRPRLPEQGVAVGESWTERRYLEEGGLALQLRLRHRLERVEAGTAFVGTTGEAGCAREGCSCGVLESEVRGRAALSLEDGLAGSSTLAVTVSQLRAEPEDSCYEGVLFESERSLVVRREGGDAEAADLDSAPPPLRDGRGRRAEARSRLGEIPLRAEIAWATGVDLPVAAGRLVEEHGLVLVLTDRAILAGGPWGEDDPVGSVDEALLAVGRAVHELPCSLEHLRETPPGELPRAYVVADRSLPFDAVRERLALLAAGSRLALLVRAPADAAGPRPGSPARAVEAWASALAARSPTALREALVEELRRGPEGCPVPLREYDGRTCPQLAPVEQLEALVEALVRRPRGCPAEDLAQLEALAASQLDARHWPWRWLALATPSDAPGAPALALPARATFDDLARALAALPEGAAEGGLRW